MGGGGGNSPGWGGAKLPQGRAQIMHIFRVGRGHLTDTPAHRRLVSDTVNDPANFLGKDAGGVSWYARMRKDGSQIWVKVFGGIVGDAGLNKKPKPWDPVTGLNRNPFKDKEKRE